MNHLISRRTALRTGLLTTLGSTLIPGAVSRVFGQSSTAPNGPHTLAPLPYGFDALEPHFDAKTMEIHHGKHHAAYVANLNKALADYPDLQKMSLEELVSKVDQVPEKIRTTVRNNAGGHLNHTLFWQFLSNESGGPDSDLEQALGELLGDSVEAAQETFQRSALSLFGSGWVWISVDKNKKLKLENLPNQDNPLMFGRQPLLGLDVWEHAYYLKYQNRRIDYVKAFGKIINWNFISARYRKLTA